MKVLILGGTAWLGRAVAESARDAGHHVTCVARGAGVADGVLLARADRDEDDALAEVASSKWDAVVDVSRQPGQVRRAVRDLAPVADRFVFVSTVSVYASQAEWGADEDATLFDPLSADAMASPADYGPAKVACENAVLDGFGVERSLILRAGVIGGPGDLSTRTSYWPLRFARPSNPQGDVLVPDAPGQPTSVIDVRDLAGWMVSLAEQRASGTFNAAGPAVLFPEHVRVASEVAGHGGRIVVASPGWLAAHAVAEWSGPRSLPLWLTDSARHGLNSRSIARALSAGLTLRPLSETLADSLAWELQRPADVVRGAGLTDEDERELLNELAS